MSTITPLHEIDLHSGYLTKPRWSPDGRFLAIPTQSGSIAIFDLESQQVTKMLGPHSDEVIAVTWDRNAEFILASSLDRSVGLWEVSTGRRAPFTISGHKEPVHSVEWTDEEAMAMTCSVDRIRAWDGFCLHTGWTDDMEEAMNSSSTRFVAASCSYRTTFLLGALAENGSLLILANFLSADVLARVQMDEPAQCLAWSPEEELIAVGTGQSILTFHATHDGFEGSPRALSKDAARVHALGFSSDGKVLGSRDAAGLLFWVRETSRQSTGIIQTQKMRSNRKPPAQNLVNPATTLLPTVTSR